MSEELDTDTIVDRIVEEDPRYPRQAYGFMMEALKHTTGKLPVRRHVTGQELSLSIREYAIRQFGISTRFILSQWGITRTRDFGEIVFNLVRAGLMRKTEEDSIDDFDDMYDFETEFDRNFVITVDKTVC
ncbi:MAG: hypothetical protein FJY97_03325 [candidate division Zixibacteria bacterium]|nr:hypothetical protein [candidate division Zixibacteria bacterium]